MTETRPGGLRVFLAFLGEAFGGDHAGVGIFLAPGAYEDVVLEVWRDDVAEGSCGFG